MNHRICNFEIRYTKAAEKFFAAHEDIRTQYRDTLTKLLCNDHPESVDVKRIQGKHGTYYRIRLGGYRVVYTIINGMVVVVSTLLAGPRGDVYKKKDGLK